MDKFMEAVKIIRFREPNLESALFDMSVVRWLPYLDIRTPSPFKHKPSDELKDAMEIYEYFRAKAPKNSFNEFLGTLNRLPKITNNCTKIKQVLNHVRIMKLVDEGKLSDGKQPNGKQPDRIQGTGHRPVQESSERELSPVDSVSGASGTASAGLKE